MVNNNLYICHIFKLIEFLQNLFILSAFFNPLPLPLFIYKFLCISLLIIMFLFFVFLPAN